MFHVKTKLLAAAALFSEEVVTLLEHSAGSLRATLSIYRAS